MLKWGIIGAGNIAHRFAASLRNEENSVLYAISGRNQEKMNAFKDEFACEKVYLSYEALLEDEEVDAVYVALPHGLHMEYCLKALQAKKAVLCEKPAALNEAQAREIVACAQRNQCVFMEAQKSRFTPMYRKIREMALEGKLGKLLRIETSNCFLLPQEMHGKTYHTDKEQGGCLLDSGIYGVSWIEDYCDGEPVVLKTYVNLKDEVDMYVQCFMKINGVDVVFESGFDRKKAQEAVLTFEHGVVKVENLHRCTKAHIVTDHEEVIEIPYDHDDFYSQINAFVKTVEEGKKENEIMPLNATARCAHIMDAIRASFSEFSEEDLALLEREEQAHVVDSFGAVDALELGNLIAKLALEYDRGVSIRIVREADGVALFQYVMDDKGERNLAFGEMKRAATIKSGHSSAWTYVNAKLGRAGEAMSGGSFPLYGKNGELIATVSVSGLHEGKDHELIVRALSQWDGKATEVFVKGLI